MVVEVGGFVRDGDEVEDGCIPLEWIGSPQPRDDPRIQFAILSKRLNGKQLRILELADANGTRPIKGRKVRRRLIPGYCTDLDHLSREYVWGPLRDQYVVAVLFRDADVILSSASGHQFRDRSKAGPELILPPKDPIRIVRDRRVYRHTSEMRPGDIFQRDGR
jgi:hypothetical protein